MQISLPGDVMSIVVRFFDTKDCARMSQVNKAWNQFLYRDSLWGTERWVLRPHMVEEIVCPKPPAGARHIGTPHKGCFLRWASEYDQLFRISMEELEKEWIRLKCPCLYVQHHHFAHVVIAYKSFIKLSKEKRVYLFHRVASPEIKESKGRYRLVLLAILNEFHHCLGRIRRFPEPPPLEPDSDDYATFRHMTQMTLYLHHTKRIESIQTCIDAVQTSIRALERRGSLVWAQNDALYKRDIYTALDSIAFPILI